MEPGAVGQTPWDLFQLLSMKARQKKTGDTGKVQAGPERDEGRAVFESSVLLELGAGGLQELREGLGEHWQGSGAGSVL